MNVKNEEGQIVKESAIAVKWMEDTRQQLEDIGPLSADLSVLNGQQKAIDDIYRTVLDKEGDVVLLRLQQITQIYSYYDLPNLASNTLLSL